MGIGKASMERLQGRCLDRVREAIACDASQERVMERHQIGYVYRVNLHALRPWPSWDHWQYNETIGTEEMGPYFGHVQSGCPLAYINVGQSYGNICDNPNGRDAISCTIR